MEDVSHFHVLSFDGIDSHLRSVRKRRHHSKVGSGCLACRVKRVKCDELRPVCLRCHRNTRICEYEQRTESHGRYFRTVQSDVSHCLSHVNVLPFAAPSTPNGTPSVYLMKHLWENWETIVNVDRRPELISLLKADPLIRSVVLALSASHLRHKAPGHRQYRIAELFQKSLALEHYQERLLLPLKVLEQEGVDILLTTAIFLNLLSFALPGSDLIAGEKQPDVESSWIFNPGHDRLDWLALQAGQRPLLLFIGPYRTEALKFTALIFTGEPVIRWRFTSIDPDPEGLPNHWIEFFELKTFSSACECVGRSNVYRPPALILAALRRSEINKLNLFRHMQFLSKLEGKFRSLIHWRDERALWLFGYWLGSICHYRLWWCERQAKQDYEAISLWLQNLQLPRRPGKEGRLWDIMMQELESLRSVKGTEGLGQGLESGLCNNSKDSILTQPLSI